MPFLSWSQDSTLDSILGFPPSGVVIETKGEVDKERKVSPYCLRCFNAGFLLFSKYSIINSLAWKIHHLLTNCHGPARY